jgi:long-chain fatty acid transport protein
LKRAISVLLSSAALHSAATAWGSGLTPPVVGQAWSGPTTADAAATYWNPAMLADVNKIRIEGNVDLVLPAINYTRVRLGVYQREDSLKFKLPLQESDIDRSKTGPEEVTGAKNTLIPAGSFFGTIPLHERVTLGLGFFGLAGAVISFPDQGPQRYQLQEASLLGLAVTAGAGVKVNDWFRIGATVYYVSGRLGLRKVADLAGTDLLGKALASPPINQPNDFGQNAPTGVRELSVLSRPFTLSGATANAATFSLGLAFEPTKSLSIGLAYIHRVPLKFKGHFALDMNDDFFTTDLAAQGLKYPPLVQGDAYVEFPLPLTVKMGLGYRVNDLVRLQFLAEYYNYSDVQNFVITLQSPDLAQPRLGVADTVKIIEPRRWKDTVSTAATAIFNLTKTIEIGVTLGYQSSAVPDETINLSSPDGDRIVGVLGARVTVGRFELAAAISVNHILTRNVTNSDYDLGNGNYHITLVLLSGNLAVSF